MPNLLRVPGLNPTLVPPPNVPVEVDWSHPLARGLTALYSPGSRNGFADITQQSPTGVPVNSPQIVVGPTGPGVQTNGTNSYVMIPAAPAFRPTRNFTMFADYIVGDTSSIGAIWGKWYIYPSGWATWLQNYQNRIIYNYHTTGDTSILCSPSVVPNKLSRISANVDLDAGTINIYSDGINIGNASGISTLSMGDAPMGIGAIFDNGSWTNYLDCFVARCGMYNRSLPPDETAWLSAEPFAMLRPIQPRRRWISPSGAIRTRPRVMLVV